ncbi:hypothetical protein [Arthrobacter sp. H14-L1]|uniref:hypothetical protein n=1 Tax=Arthrobacter sp. H14-L1 TaxID=2996697 RepID=UPI00226F0056|nr:hypothetical protein [Arthrobacter sp. H14-L1]MCY0903675.1 hypothetical protein [Arthrobacter sp. H14-L1]
MGTQISGRQWAARITTAVTAGSLATAGIAAVAVDMATTSHAAATTSVTSQDGGSSQNPDGGQGAGDSVGGAVQPGTGQTVHGRSSGS